MKSKRGGHIVHSNNKTEQKIRRHTITLNVVKNDVLYIKTYY